MDFLKKHYEKVLLGVVLAGLVLAVGFLPFKISSDKQALEERRSRLLPKSVKPLTNMDMTLPEAALKRMATPAVVSFAPPNLLFNPMPWQKKPPPDESLVLATSLGAAAATVTNITPLYLRLSLDSVTISADGSARYVIGVTREAAPNLRDRTKKQTGSTVGMKTDVFVLREVKGKPDDPSALVLELNDTGETAIVTKDQPFKRVDGYKASLNYDPENKKWADRRVGDRLSFNGEDYKIVGIKQDEVVLCAQSTSKNWIVKYRPNPES
jgi:hypothetical protein